MMRSSWWVYKYSWEGLRKTSKDSDGLKWKYLTFRKQHHGIIKRFTFKTGWYKYGIKETSLGESKSNRLFLAQVVPFEGLLQAGSLFTLSILLTLKSKCPFYSTHIYNKLISISKYFYK